MQSNARKTAQLVNRSALDPVGYTWDAAAYCPECFPAGVDRDNADEVGAIFEWDEAACELSCDVCLGRLQECDGDEVEDND
jgi:hypothetical protein